jgi:hypothetical protein
MSRQERFNNLERQFSQEDVHYKDHIMTIDNFLMDTTIDTLFESWKKAEDRGYTYSRREQGHNPDQLEIKDSAITHFDMPRMLTTDMNVVIDYVNHFGLGEYDRKYGLLDIPEYKEIYVSGAKMQKTAPGEGYHVWHHEHGPDNANRNAIMAWMVYLNDVDDGGETEFLHQHVRMKPLRNQLVMWPAYFTHLHRGNPPLKTDKYIITGWCDYF